MLDGARAVDYDRGPVAAVGRPPVATGRPASDPGGEQEVDDHILGVALAPLHPVIHAPGGGQVRWANSGHLTVPAVEGQHRGTHHLGGPHAEPDGSRQGFSTTRDAGPCMAEAPLVQRADHLPVVDPSPGGQIGSEVRADRVGDQRPTTRGAAHRQITTERGQGHELPDGHLVQRGHGEPSHRERGPVGSALWRRHSSSSSGRSSPSHPSAGPGMRASVATIGLGNSFTPQTFPSRKCHRAI